MEVTFNGMISIPNFINIGSKVDSGDRHTDRKGDLISLLLPLGRK
jgi:hypothetical protein